MPNGRPVNRLPWGSWVEGCGVIIPFLLGEDVLLGDRSISSSLVSLSTLDSPRPMVKSVEVCRLFPNGGWKEKEVEASLFKFWNVFGSTESTTDTFAVAVSSPCLEGGSVSPSFGFRELHATDVESPALFST